MPTWWPSRLYYGWALVAALGLTATVSYGILSYGFSVFIAPMSTELGWSKTQITGAFSLAQLIAGAAAIPVGLWVDRHGARALMTAGSLLSTALLVGWSFVHTLVAFYVLHAVMGVVLAAVLYEPMFAVVATWFRLDRSRALTMLTFMGGFASVIFVPLASQLVSRVGWREALLWLALLLFVFTALPHALVLRRRPSDLGLEPDGIAGTARDMGRGESKPGKPEISVAAREAVRGRTFRWIAVSFALSGLTTTAISVHLVPLLLERGYDMGFAGAAMGVLGLMALPGRLIFTPLGGRVSRAAVTASIFALQALAAVALLTSRSTAAVWVFVILFGAGFGAITPARAALVSDLFGAEHYGKISGVLVLVVSLARAAAPVGASLLYAMGGLGRGYDVVVTALLLLCIGSGAAVLLAGDGDVSKEPARNMELSA